MAGYECSDQLNHHGDRVDLLKETGHADFISRDYALLEPFDIATVREGIRWSQVEQKPYQYDFSTVAAMIDAARMHGIQQIWDICHFGYPDDLSPLHPHFTARFVALCSAFANFYKVYCPGVQLLVTPINEVGFISWLGGDHASTTPYAKGMGWDVKYALIRSYIQGIKAMKSIHSDVAVLTTEPIVNIVPPLYATEETLVKAEEAHEIQYQAMDMLTGRMCPELGGSMDLIDYMGVNFYYNNQWILDEFTFLPWFNEDEDPRWRGLSSLLQEAYQRYGKPIVLAETSHPGEHRPNWIRFITAECIKTLQYGVPLMGVCLYPIIDRPDWDHLHVWHHSGLWDADAENPFDRRLNLPYAREILHSQQALKPYLFTASLSAVNIEASTEIISTPATSPSDTGEEM